MEIQQLNHLNEMTERGEIIVGLIEQAMSESRSYQYSEEAIEEKRFKEFGLDALLLVQTLDYQVSSKQT